MKQSEIIITQNLIISRFIFVVFFFCNEICDHTVSPSWLFRMIHSWYLLLTFSWLSRTSCRCCCRCLCTHLHTSVALVWAAGGNKDSEAEEPPPAGLRKLQLHRLSQERVWDPWPQRRLQTHQQDRWDNLVSILSIELYKLTVCGIFYQGAILNIGR